MTLSTALAMDGGSLWLSFDDEVGFLMNRSFEVQGTPRFNEILRCNRTSEEGAVLTSQERRDLFGRLLDLVPGLIGTSSDTFVVDEFLKVISKD